jgi:hypothetical protein
LDEHKEAAPGAGTAQSIRLHLRVGWSGLLLFVALGVVLEALHAWKAGMYLGVDNETRRLMWTLAHAHGVGLSLLQVGFAATLRMLPSASLPPAATSKLINAATLLVPLGFFAGGVNTYEADPGFGILLVPIGALALLAALGLVVRAVFSFSTAP